MSGTKRCDEVLRLIDAVLAEHDAAMAPPARPSQPKADS
jgi:hypothetical protein